MSQSLRLLDLFEGKRYQKAILTVSVAAFLLLELLIYLAAASQAGQQSRVVITDGNGAKVFETAGAALTSYEKLVFENNFGPLRNFRINVETESREFPFRAWLSSAVGIPVGLVLLMAFLVRAYLSLLYGGERKESSGEPEAVAGGSFASLLTSLHRVSVFHVGFLVVVAVLLLWMVPNLLGDFAKVGMAAIQEYKWFFLGAAAFLALLIMWIIYLRYRLSKQMLDNQLHLEKYRLEQQLLLHRESPNLLPSGVGEAQSVKESSISEGI